MKTSSEINAYFTELQGKVEKLIHLHEDAVSVNKKLMAEKRQITLELEEQREKFRRLEEGYKNLKEIEKSSSRNSITNMKKKINDIILEIDRNMTLIEEK